MTDHKKIPGRNNPEPQPRTRTPPQVKPIDEPGIVTGAPKIYMARVRSLALLVYAPPGPPQDIAEFGFATARSARGCNGNYTLSQENRMATGTVKWFNPTKGYGFIQPQGGGGGKDVFVHISAVEKAGLSTLNEGQHVEYELVTNRGKTSAENLKVK
jgi:CspA family cold shock protein